MRRATLTIALFGHACAWVAFLFLVFWPSSYTGRSVTAVAVNNGDLPSRAALTAVEPGVTTETFSASIVEVNGLRVVPILAIPVALTAVAAMAAIMLRTRPRFGMSLMWSSTILAVMFSILGSFSVGLFYFPAALAMILAATIGSVDGIRGPPAAPDA